MSLAAYIVAIVLFALGALTSGVAGIDRGDLVVWGFVAFVLGHVLPAGVPEWRRR